MTVVYKTGKGEFYDQDMDKTGSPKRGEHEVALGREKEAVICTADEAEKS